MSPGLARGRVLEEQRPAQPGGGFSHPSFLLLFIFNFYFLFFSNENSADLSEGLQLVDEEERNATRDWRNPWAL